MERFCPVCGNATDELYESRCRSCFIREKAAVDLPSNLEIKACKKCMKYFYRGKWSGRKTSIEELLEKAAAKIIETEFLPAESKNNRVSVSIGRLRKSTAPVSAEISGTIYGASYSISSNSNIKAIFEVCARCSKMAGGYYEGVFQVRGDMSDEEKEKIKKRVSSIKPIDTFITDLRVLRYGIDFYLSSAKGTKKIARMLRSELGGSTIETSKLVGRSREGKDLHRVTVVLRLPERR